MMKADTPQNTRGAVVTLSNRAREPQHEASVHAELARRIAELQGMAFLGEYDPAMDYSGKLYFVPSGTVIGAGQARELGLGDETDLFGGVVPQAFVETKAISHPLIRPDAEAPVGWSRPFGARVKGCVLRGYSAFSLADAREVDTDCCKMGCCGSSPCGQPAAVASKRSAVCMSWTRRWRSSTKRS